MKKDLFQNKYKNQRASKILFADLICFLLVAIVSVGFCYSYFSSKSEISGTAKMANVSIEYRDDAHASVSNISATLNDSESSLTSLTNIQVEPGDKITLKGEAFNSSKVNVFVLAKLEVVNKDASSNVIDKEVVWYNIAENKAIYSQQGLFQVGASSLNANTAQSINISYTLDGERYSTKYSKIEMNLELKAYQMTYLNSASDYDEYQAVGTYSQDCIYATHQMIGKWRDKWEANNEDANVADLSFEDLKTDTSGAYLINSCKDWMILKTYSTQANTQNKTFKLNAYLDFNNTATEKTIPAFYGNLDGQGYTISNWTGNQGLIGSAYGNISNLGVDGVSIYNLASANQTYVGAIAGSLDKATLSNCFVIGKSAYDASTQYDIQLGLSSKSNCAVGGLVGKLVGSGNAEYSANIKNCYAVAKLAITGAGSETYVGGLVGATSANKDKLIENCYFVGNLYDAVGYRCGLIVAVPHCDIKNSFAITTLSTTSHAKCIVGSEEGGPVITNCAYINKEENNNVTKVGVSQTSKQVIENSFKSVGFMRDEFNWSTAVWGNNIYNNSNNQLFPVLRAFYNS